MTILQYNIAKGRDRMNELFHIPNIRKVDVIAIQEPWRNGTEYTTHHPLKDQFHLIYPQYEDSRVCFFVNKQMALTSWFPTFHSPDLCTLTIRTECSRIIHIHNLYNPCRNTGRSGLSQLQTAIEQREGDEQIALGDFNLHHPSWGGPEAKTDSDSEELLFQMAQMQMEQIRPERTITYRSGQGATTIDLVFATPAIARGLITCSTSDEFDVHSDHEPIVTTTAYKMEQEQPYTRRKWKDLRVDKFRKLLQSSMTKDGVIRPHLGGQWGHKSNQELDVIVNCLIKLIREATQESAPLVTITPRSKPGFTAECKEAQAEAKRLKRRWKDTGTEWAWEAFREARNYKGRLIKKAMQKSWRAFTEEACQSPGKMWKVTRWSRNRTPKQDYLPALSIDGQRVAEPEKKAECLLRAFFPPPVRADLNDISNYNGSSYPKPFGMGRITEHEVRKAILSSAPLKAPGGDEIPNRVLQVAIDIILPLMVSLFNACLNNAYCPEHFRESITVVLKKPGKADYSVPKAYRPIALLNTLGKALEKVVAERIASLAEEHRLLPSAHMGGRRLRSSEMAIHHLLEHVYGAWGKRKVASLLLLDVAGAYDKVSHKRLLHNLRKRSIDNRLVCWIASFLKDRSTMLKTNEFSTTSTAIDVGIPQGSPLSPILYLFYNSDLLESATNRPDLHVKATGFVDDVGLLTYGNSTDENCVNLSRFHKEECLQWARKHGSEFDIGKYQLIHLSRATKKFNLDVSLHLDGHTVSAGTKVRYLGVELDRRLKWNEQIASIRQKALKSVGALTSLAGSVWGGNFKALRKIYTGVVVPQLTHCCTVWHQHQDAKDYHSGHLKALEDVQRHAALRITGAFKATSSEALDVESHLLPLKLTLESKCLTTTARLATSPAYHDVIAPRTAKEYQRRTRKPKAEDHKSPLERHEDVFEREIGSLRTLERFQPFTASPDWDPPPATIAETKEEAIEQAKRREATEDMLIYTDGSGINGKIGAAAVAPALNWIWPSYLGDTSWFTVYAAELQGILNGIEISVCYSNRMQGKTVIILTDNQAAIQAVSNPSISSGQYLVIDIVRAINELRKRGCSVELQWVPAHMDVPGNEKADREAKEATGWRERITHGRQTERDTSITAPAILNPLRLLTAIKTAVKTRATEKWRKAWSDSKRGATLKIIQSQPSRDVLKLHENTQRWQSSLIVQMRTGKIGLRDFLFRRWIPGVEDGRCKCKEGLQTVRHVLTKCREFGDERKKEWGSKAREAGGEGVRLDDMLMKGVNAVRAARFMKTTGLLGQYQSVQEEDQSQGQAAYNGVNAGDDAADDEMEATRSDRALHPPEEQHQGNTTTDSGSPGLATARLKGRRESEWLVE